MYFFEEGKTILVESLGNGSYCYRSRLTNEKVLDSRNLDAIPTNCYRPFLEDRIENPEKDYPKTLSPVVKDVEVREGDLCKLNDDNIYKLEKIIETDNISLKLLSIQEKVLDGGKTELTEADCKFLEIPYRRGLYSFNIGTDLTKYDPNEKIWIPEDLSTYPLDENKTQIKYMILKISGFKATNDGGVLMIPDSDSVLDLELFLVSLKVKLKESIESLSGGSSWNKGEEISWSIISESFEGSKREQEEDTICDTDGNIYLILKLVKNKRGISPYSIRNKAARDLFEVTWDMSYSIGSESSKDSELVESTDKVPRYDFNIFEQIGNLHWRSVGSNQKYIPLTRQR